MLTFEGKRRRSLKKQGYETHLVHIDGRDTAGIYGTHKKRKRDQAGIHMDTWQTKRCMKRQSRQINGYMVLREM